jgi:hypothetical protein
MTLQIEKTFIKYTIEDDGKISHITLSLSEVENGMLYSILHDTELHTCIAKVIKRELIEQ